MLPEPTPPDELNTPPPEPATTSTPTSVAIHRRGAAVLRLSESAPARRPAAGGRHLAAQRSRDRCRRRFVFALSLLDTVLLLGLIVWLIRRRGERPGAVFFGDRPIPSRSDGRRVLTPTGAHRRHRHQPRHPPRRPSAAQRRAEPARGSARNARPDCFAFLFVVIVAGGLREELQRVFLLHRFRQDLGGVRVGLLITSVAFGLGHTLQGWDAAVITALLGALWGWISLTRGSAVASIVSHSLFNSGELIRAVFQVGRHFGISTTSVRRRRSATQSAISSLRRAAASCSRSSGVACSNVVPAFSNSARRCV